MVTKRPTRLDKPARTLKRRPLWVCRDKWVPTDYHECYVLNFKKKDALACKTVEPDGSIIFKLPASYPEHTSRGWVLSAQGASAMGLYLEPGTGPVKVQFTAEIL